MIKTVVIGPTEHTRLCLEEILKTDGYQVSAVFGSSISKKHKKARWTTFNDLAEFYKFELIYCNRFKDPENIKIIQDLNPDVIFEFGSSELIPKDVLEIPKYGCIGSHGGPLPQIKGGATLNWALLRDEREWGVSLYYLSEKADEGDIIGVSYFNIDDRDDIKTLHDKSDYHTINMLRKVLFDLKSTGNTERIKQLKADGIFLPQRKPTDAEIKWDAHGREIFNFVRAQTHPFPGAYTYLDDEKLSIWRGSYTSGINFQDITEIQNGTLYGISYGKGFLVKCDDGYYIIERISDSSNIEYWGDDFFKIRGLKNGYRFRRKD